MKDENNPMYGAIIERGIVSEAQNGAYTVVSCDRPGVVTPPLKTINSTTLYADDRVFFFMFKDGSGRIIDKMDV